LDLQNKDTKTAEAYGLEFLYTDPEPIMEIRIWQKNEKERTDYPEYSTLSDFFYERVPLTLRKGENVDMTCDQKIISSDGIWSALIEVIYNGDITRGYNIIAPHMLNYTNETNMIPKIGVSGEDIRRNDDTTFVENCYMILSILRSYGTGTYRQYGQYSSRKSSVKCGGLFT